MKVKEIFIKNKRIFWVVILLVISTIISGILGAINKNSDKIPDGYIAVFHGGAGEQTYETYIYKINNEHSNYGFDYINTTSTTISCGSSEWNTKITKRGSVDWTDGVFEVAKENNAYSFVTLPNRNKTYTIEEFMKRFLMD